MELQDWIADLVAGSRLVVTIYQFSSIGFTLFTFINFFQMNANTHFLDLSLVYGSDDKTAEDLRTKENGKLKVSPLKNHHEKLLLPPGESPLGRPCSLAREISGVEESSEIKCFNAGEKYC